MAFLFFFELGFLSVLFYLLHDAEQRAEKEARAKTVFKAQHRLSRSMYSSYELFVKWKGSLSDSYKKEFDSLRSLIASDLDFLQKVTAENLKTRSLPLKTVPGPKTEADSDDDDPYSDLSRIMAIKQQAEDVFVEIFDLIERTRLASAQTKAEIAAQGAENLRGPMDNLKTAALSLTKNSGSGRLLQAYAGGKEESLMPKQMEIAVLLGLVINVLISLLLTLYFARQISSRVETILDNTRKLRQQKSLHPALAGADEIALLDRSFHEMSRQILEHERLRKAYIAIFRDELSEPLGELRASIVQIEKEEKEKLNKQGFRMLESARRNLSRLLSIVDTLVESNSLDAGKLKLLLKESLLSEIVSEAIDSVAEFARRKNIKIESSIENAPLICDPEKLVQVLVNFLSNAAKFSDEGMTVRVEALCQDEQLLVSVIDSGRGIAEDKQSEVFEQFKQSEQSDGKRGVGSGLGLSICKKIIELHGGQIGFESKLGEGSKFWFKISRLSEGKV